MNIFGGCKAGSEERKICEDHYGKIITLDENFVNRAHYLDELNVVPINPNYELTPHLKCNTQILNYHLKRWANSEKLSQNTNDSKQLILQAENTRKRLQQFLYGISKQYSKSKVLIGPPKSEESINYLLKARWNGDASRITDYVRATLSFNNLQDLYNGLQKIKNSGLIILNIHDNFGSPTEEGYRDVNINFRDFINGHIGEIQLNLHSVLDYKTKEGHKLFEKIRTLRATPKIFGRELNLQEKKELNILISKSKYGYENAFMKDNRLPIRKGVYLIITNDNKEILFTKTKSGDRFIYNFPGGGAKEGEKDTETLKREVYEEIGLKINFNKDPIYITNGIHINPDYPQNFMKNIYYKSAVNLNHKSVKGFAEVAECKWFKLEEAPQDQMLSVDLELIEHLRSTLN